ncbi:MAG: tetratricopeptide repeat protein [Candidatus Saccharimonas sp.]|nr:tetratricopeptide repeat protein [Planctomycetaceae bacterium]
MASVVPSSIRSAGRRSRSARARLFRALLTVVVVSSSVVGLVVWYEQDRPLHEIEAALKGHRIPLALQLVSGYLREHPEDARAQAIKARILVEAGQLAEALRLFHRMGASDAADLHAWAKAHLLRQEWSDALPVLERLLQFSPNDPDALHEITACRSFLGKYRQAFESAERLAAQPGHEARAWLQIGTLHENLGNKRSAVEAWARVLDHDPQAENLQVSAAEFFGEYGQVLLEDGHPETACEVLRRSLTLKEDAEIRSSLGQALRQIGDENGAIAAWKQVLESTPTLREPRESLADVALRSGNFEEARNWLEPALAGLNVSSSSTYLMQRICLATGDREAAQTWQTRTEELRRREKLRSAINHVLVESPESFWARAIRAYQFAEAGNWHQAEVFTSALLAESARQPFLLELAACVRTRGPLPSLKLLPIHQF